MTSTALDVRGLSVARGPRTVVDGVSFAASPAEVVALMGASGSGKTTILRAIAGLEPIAGGAIAIGDLRLGAGGRPRGHALTTLRKRVGMVFQFHHLFDNLTALENVWLAPVHVHRQPRPGAESRAQALLESLGVGHRAHAMPPQLSGGEAQRVAIARALAMEPPVLLMDEPTASLDPERRSDLAQTLRTLAADGRVIVIATHDAEFASSCAHRVVRLAMSFERAAKVSGTDA